MTERAPIGALVRLFFRLGSTGFGGPLVHIAMMESEVVERRRWLSRSEFLDHLALCQMLPGPASTQLAVLICYARGGLGAALLGGGAFVLPGFVIMLALTLLHARWGALPALRGIFVGIAPVVVAIIAFATWRLGRAVVTRVDLTVPCALGFALSAFLGLDTVIVLLLSGGLWVAYRRMAASPTTVTAAAFPLLAVADPDVYARLAWLWVKMGALVYGGGYVIIPVVRGEAVERFGWLSDRVFLDGLALAQVTPGPIVNLSVFVGYQAGGVLGSVVAAASVFAPAFAVVLAAAPLMDRVKGGRSMKLFLEGVNGAVVGAIAAATIPLARGAIVSPLTALLGAVALALLWRGRPDTVWLVLVGGVVGWLSHLVP